MAIPKLYSKDLLAVCLIDKLHLTPIKSGAVGFIGYGILGYGLGLWLSFQHLYNARIDKIWLGPQLLAAIIALIVLPTILWWFYIYQLKKISDVIESIELTDGLVGEQVMSIFNQRRWSGLAFISAVAFCIGWYILIALPAMTPPGLVPWWFMNRHYLYFIFLPLIALQIYMGVMIIFRQLFAIRILNSLFKQSDPVIHPLHPDGAGGLAKLGHFAITTAFAGVFVGFWAVSHSSGPIQRGFGPEPPWYTLGLLLLYIILTPVLLIAPVWTAHDAMKRVKSKLLSKISEKFDRKAENFSKQRDIKKLNEELLELVKAHELIKERYPEWPFHLPTLRRFGITSILPLILEIVSSVSNFITISIP